MDSGIVYHSGSGWCRVGFSASGLGRVDGLWAGFDGSSGLLDTRESFLKVLPPPSTRIMTALAVTLRLLAVSLANSYCPAQDPTGAARVDRAPVGTELFGLVAEGAQFVYVLDRSASMGDFGGKPLRALKRELQRSLEPLSPVQQFQIVFYNHRPRLVRLEQDRPTMIWANEEGKERALRFVNQMDATGGTDHLAALRIGLALRPDILFFLTDADRPQLTASDLKTASRLNGGTRIYAIELGQGEAPGGSNVLQDLAEQSGGRYRYLDILQWDERSPGQR